MAFIKGIAILWLCAVSCRAGQLGMQAPLASPLLTSVLEAPPAMVPAAGLTSLPADATASQPQLDSRTVILGERKIQLLLDKTHLEAHRDDFSVPFEDILGIIGKALSGTRTGSIVKTVTSPRIVGRSRLVRLKDNQEAYWGLRPGRAYPSRLTRGAPAPTRMLTVSGHWIDRRTFHVHTFHPGPQAPREIHDPELKESDRARSIRFWSKHALIAP